jgi:hypothetical protein
MSQLHTNARLRGLRAAFQKFTEDAPDRRIYKPFAHCVLFMDLQPK